MLLRIQYSSKRPSCVFAVDHHMHHLALTWAAKARRCGISGGGNGWGLVFDAAAGVIWRTVIAAIHLVRLTYRRSAPVSRCHPHLLTCAFSCCMFVEDASFTHCPGGFNGSGGDHWISGIRAESCHLSSWWRLDWTCPQFPCLPLRY